MPVRAVTALQPQRDQVGQRPDGDAVTAHVHRGREQCQVAGVVLQQHRRRHVADALRRDDCAGVHHARIVPVEPAEQIAHGRQRGEVAQPHEHHREGQQQHPIDAGQHAPEAHDPDRQHRQHGGNGVTPLQRRDHAQQQHAGARQHRRVGGGVLHRPLVQQHRLRRKREPAGREQQRRHDRAGRRQCRDVGRKRQARVLPQQQVLRIADRAEGGTRVHRQRLEDHQPLLRHARDPRDRQRQRHHQEQRDVVGQHGGQHARQGHQHERQRAHAVQARDQPQRPQLDVAAGTHRLGQHQQTGESGQRGNIEPAQVCARRTRIVERHRDGQHQQRQQQPVVFQPRNGEAQGLQADFSLVLRCAVPMQRAGGYAFSPMTGTGRTLRCRDCLRREGPAMPVRHRLTALFAATALALTGALPAASAAPVVHAAAATAASPWGDLHWRLIGPFRAGRTLAVTGVIGQPNHFYMGSVNGGVWETRDTGRTWQPVFDAEPIGSIGAIAVAPSNPNVIYVGTGEADMRSDIAQGEGMYKSVDGGKTWTHIGLTDSQQIAMIRIDPHNPDRVFVAALGHPYGPNAERGVFRSLDGGRSWKKVLGPNDDTGAIDLIFKPGDASTIYAALWQTRCPPWNVYPPSNGPGSGLYKSTDGGSTWTRLEGLPSKGLGRIGIAISDAAPDRVYAIVDAEEGGLYRSDDAGAHWKKMSGDPRIWQRGWYFGQITADPKDPDRIYAMNTIELRSDDGGKTFIPVKGDPTGDDYHELWIDPADPDRQIMGVDQGAIITVNGGRTWSSWFNQPTAQLYHVSTDNRFPYRVYGAQQDSGAVGIPSRNPYNDRISMEQFHEVTAGG